MLTGCQKFLSLLTRSYKHGFIKISKLYRSFSDLNDQNMNAQEAKLCIYCTDFLIRQEIVFWRPSWMPFLILKPGNNDFCQI